MEKIKIRNIQEELTEELNRARISIEEFTAIFYQFYKNSNNSKIDKIDKKLFKIRKLIQDINKLRG